MQVGWKAIAKDIGIPERTLRRYVKIFDMPVLRTPTGRPMFSKEAFEMWVSAVREIKVA